MSGFDSFTNEPHSWSTTMQNRFWGKLTLCIHPQLGLTYLEVQQKVAEEWVTLFNDADWSTRFHWEEATPTTSSKDDVNLFSAMFDVIADATGIKFDFKKATELYEKGEVWIKNNAEDYEKEGRKRSEFLERIYIANCSLEPILVFQALSRLNLVQEKIKIDDEN